jgi:hypothetical protein
LQWQKRRRGEARERWVLKTPAHLGYLDTLLTTFPDAHVVHMHRNPLETIPSGASLNYTLWRMYADEVDPTRVGRQWIERMAWANQRALAFRASAPDAPARFSDLSYRDAVTDPVAQLGEIYRAIGSDFSPEVQSEMRRWLAAQSSETRPAHRYSAESFGLTEDRIREAFADYFEAYGDHFTDPVPR